MREFIASNACEWIREFHLDGLRLDATQNIHDASELHVLAELCEKARAAAAPRKILVMAENEPQHAGQMLSPAQGGLGYDGMWNDDFRQTTLICVKLKAIYSVRIANADSHTSWA